jgi:hypothetical protein
VRAARSARDDLAAAAAQRAARQKAAEGAEAKAEAQRDAIEISEAATRSVESSTAEREARVRELAEEHRMERLHNPERIERAAQRLLEG